MFCDLFLLGEKFQNMVPAGIEPAPSRCKREGLPLAYGTKSHGLHERLARPLAYGTDKKRSLCCLKKISLVK